jgi:hypothetical protein
MVHTVRWQQFINAVARKYKVSAPDVNKPFQDSQKRQEEKAEKRMQWRVMGEATDTLFGEAE